MLQKLTLQKKTPTLILGKSVRNRTFPPVPCLILTQKVILMSLEGGRSSTWTWLRKERTSQPHRLRTPGLGQGRGSGRAGRHTPRGTDAKSLGQGGPRDVPERGKVLKAQGVTSPVPALALSTPDGVCLQHTRYHTRKLCVTTSMPNTTHDSRDVSIASWSWVLGKSNVARGER